MDPSFILAGLIPYPAPASPANGQPGLPRGEQFDTIEHFASDPPMNLHEYQAKELFHRHGIPVPAFRFIAHAANLAPALAELAGPPWIVKAQVHAGGRGEAGAVRTVHSVAEAESLWAEWQAAPLVTRQTGPEGLPVAGLLAEPISPIQQEFYAAAVIDRQAERIAVLLSGLGGTDIESAAARDPTAVHRVWVDPIVGFMPYQGRRLGFALGRSAAQAKALAGVLGGLVNLLQASDASLVEINPLALNPAGEWLALDAKVSLDDNAAFRQRELSALTDPSQTDPREREAHHHGLNYIPLHGDIACLVNGAGLAMATMDLIQLHGGEPANFLDVGGGTTADRVAAAFRLILSDAGVRSILVNIFGGIVRCDLIAEGLIQAVAETDIAVPVVVRLEGTRAEAGLERLRSSGLALTTAASLEEAARKAVEAARGES